MVRLFFTHIPSDYNSQDWKPVKLKDILALFSALYEWIMMWEVPVNIEIKES